MSGLLLKKELDYLKGAGGSPQKPMAAIVGGAKVSTQIPVTESMLDNVDNLIIGNGRGFTFLKPWGLSVGPRSTRRASSSSAATGPSLS